MTSEARVHVIDPNVAGKLLVVRETYVGQLEILMVSRLTDDRLVLPGLARRKDEATFDLFHRIAGTIFVGGTSRLSYETAVRVLNEHNHPVPPIQKLFLVTDFEKLQVSAGVWVNPALLTDFIAPEEWAPVMEGLKYFLTPKGKRKDQSFFYMYRGLGTAAEIASYDAEIEELQTAPWFGEFGRDITLHEQLARMHPEQYFQPRITALILRHGYTP